MGPIFNKKVAEMCNLWDCEQCTDALFTLIKSTIAVEKKKKRKKRRTQFWKRRRRNNCNPNGHKVLQENAPCSHTLLFLPSVTAKGQKECDVASKEPSVENDGHQD